MLSIGRKIQEYRVKNGFSQEALAEYQTDLKLNPNRFNGLYGAARAAEAAGKQSDANKYYALLIKTCEGGNSTRPELTHARELLAKK